MKEHNQVTAPVAVSAPDHRECIGSRRSWSLGGWQPLPYRIIEGLLVNRSQRADDSQSRRRVYVVGVNRNIPE
jgi:hypothetical protein